MDPQHHFQVVGFVPALPFVVVRLNDPYPLAPRDDAVDLLQKFLLPRVRLP